MAQDNLRIVVIGGGFAGIACVRRLERLLPRTCRLTFINDENYLVFQPLLPEVVSAGIEPEHVVSPIRHLLRRAEFLAGEVQRIDLAQRRIEFERESRHALPPIEFDHLVLTLGSIVDLRKYPGMTEHGHLVRTVADALALRIHIIERLERANALDDPAAQRGLTSFVVVGGGFSGVEIAAELDDMLRRVRRYYPRLPADAARVTIIHSGPRLLPELSERLGRSAEAVLRRAGVDVRLHSRVRAVSVDTVFLQSGATIQSENVICTIGTAPNPLVAELGLATERGRLLTDEGFRVPGQDRLWAAGDCAATPDGQGGYQPPTAQHAFREGKHLAGNLAAVLAGRPPTPFRFRTIGQLASLGHHTAVGEIGGVRIRGILAWWIWRTVYLSKLPTLNRKLRVLVDWTLDLFFPRDILSLSLRRTGTLTRIHLEAGEVLFRQGDPSDCFYVVQTGAVQLRREEEGRLVISERLGPGSHFGEGSLLRDRIHTATATALEPSSLLVLGVRDFDTIMKFSASLREAMERTRMRFRPVRELAFRNLPAAFLVQRILTICDRDVSGLPATATLAEGIQFLDQHRRMGVVPLLDDAGRPIAVMTATDFYRALDDEVSLATPMVERASRNLAAIPAFGPVLAALQVFRRRKVKRLLVVDATGHLVGVLSHLDLALAFAGDPSATV